MNIGGLAASALALSLSGPALAAAPEFGEAILAQRDGLFLLDYQDIQLQTGGTLDLIGYHILTPINDWAYVGLGGYAPFLQGDFGGFMAFGVLAHAQVDLTDRLFATAGLSFGGGGGGKSILESVELSGTGGFARAYLGLGVSFENFALGANISHMKFFNSAINNTQLDVFFQRPFTYKIGSYGHAGRGFSSVPPSDDPGSMLSFGLDNYVQIDPVGSYKGAINAVDIQFTRFMSPHSYWFYAGGVGYRGLPIYNQVFAGLGLRAAPAERLRFYGQIGLGSGGYAPTLIDTGSGLMLYPKLAAEFLIRDNLGVSLTSGFSFALDGTAKNFTLGVALNRHFGGEAQAGGVQGRYEGYRFSLSHETTTSLSLYNAPLPSLSMITVQADKLISAHFYIPARVAISYKSFKGLPGYGEISAGIGVQNRYQAGDALQSFADVQIGANVQGVILRAAIGLDYALSEGLALRASIGQTYGEGNFRSTSIVLGLTSRFSLLNN